MKDKACRLVAYSLHLSPKKSLKISVKSQVKYGPDAWGDLKC